MRPQTQIAAPMREVVIRKSLFIAKSGEAPYSYSSSG